MGRTSFRPLDASVTTRLSIKRRNQSLQLTHGGFPQDEFFGRLWGERGPWFGRSTFGTRLRCERCGAICPPKELGASFQYHSKNLNRNIWLINDPDDIRNSINNYYSWQ